MAVTTDVTVTFASRSISDSDTEEGSRVLGEIKIESKSQFINCMETDEKNCHLWNL
jgi:hypothetical protein